MEKKRLSLPKTREDAAKKGEQFYFTGDACKNGHVAKRYTTSGRCVMCVQEEYEKKIRLPYQSARKKKSELICES
jgi:hypothetical protein